MWSSGSCQYSCICCLLLVLLVLVSSLIWTSDLICVCGRWDVACISGKMCLPCSLFLGTMVLLGALWGARPNGPHIQSQHNAFHCFGLGHMPAHHQTRHGHQCSLLRQIKSIPFFVWAASDMPTGRTCQAHKVVVPKGYCFSLPSCAIVLYMMVPSSRPVRIFSLGIHMSLQIWTLISSNLSSLSNSKSTCHSETLTNWYQSINANISIRHQGFKRWLATVTLAAVMFLAQGRWDENHCIDPTHVIRSLKFWTAQRRSACLTLCVIQEEKLLNLIC